jgi:hypothetical protein
MSFFGNAEGYVGNLSRMECNEGRRHAVHLGVRADTALRKTCGGEAKEQRRARNASGKDAAQGFAEA